MNRINIWIALMPFALLFMITGCDKRIFSDLSNCPQGVYVSLYTMTPCQRDTMYIDEISKVDFFAFDEHQVLRSITKLADVDLHKDNSTLITLPTGVYTIVSVVGANDDLYEYADAEIGVTNKEQLLLSLRNNTSLGKNKLWYGESGIVNLPSTEKYGEVYRYTKINMQEKTRRVNVSIAIDETSRDEYQPQDIGVTLTTSATHLNYEGKYLRKQEVVTLPSKMEYSETSVSTSFSLMGIPSGYDNILTIRNLKSKDKEIMWEGDIIHFILNEAPNINLNCVMDYDIKFIVKDKCTDCNNHVVIAITINDYEIHSYIYDGSIRY